MFIVIAGGGIVGRGITKILSKNHDVVVIDKDYDTCEQISSKYGAVAVLGDATSLTTLRDAGIEKCDYALAVMGNDSSNLLFALLCKDFNVQNIFVRMRDPQYRKAYSLAGATNIGHSVEMMVNKFVFDIENPKIRKVVSLSNGKAEVSIITLTEKSKTAGMKIMDVAKMKGFPSDVVIAGLFDLEKDEFLIPNGNTVIQSNHQVFLVGSGLAIERAYQFFLK